MRDGLLEIGDVFVSATLGTDVSHPIELQENAPPRLLYDVLDVHPFSKFVTSWWTERNADGWQRRHEAAINTDAADPARATARFVVASAGMGGGGIGHGPHDVFPDGWQVHAIRLRKDGSYDPEGERVTFYQSGAFRSMLKDVEVVGRMRLAFVPT